MLNNREIAISILLAAFIIIVFISNRTRSSAIAVIQNFLNLTILVPLFAMFGYIYLEVWIASKAGIWNPDLLKETIIWSVTSGIVLFFNYQDVFKKPDFFKRRLVTAFGVVVFIEVFVNLYAFSLLLEIVLQIVLVFLVLLSTAAGLIAEHRPVKKLADFIIGAIGITLVFFTATQVISEWALLDKSNLVLDFALPVWLTVGLLPFVYALSLYASYQILFRLLKLHSDNKRSYRYALLALLIGLNVQAYKLGNFNGKWLIDVSTKQSFSEALAVVKNFNNQIYKKAEAS